MASYGAPASYGGCFGMPPQAQANFAAAAAMGGPFWPGMPSAGGSSSEGAPKSMDALSLAYYSQLGAQQMAALAAAQVGLSPLC